MKMTKEEQDLVDVMRKAFHGVKRPPGKPDDAYLAAGNAAIEFYKKGRMDLADRIANKIIDSSYSSGGGHD
jgi:hypothetical protein